MQLTRDFLQSTLFFRRYGAFAPKHQRLPLYVEVLRHRSNGWNLRGEAIVEGTLCASGELLASVVDREG